MIFQVIAPFETTIYGDSFKEAVKSFIKLNHDLKLTEMIIKDQGRNIQAQIKYYQEDGRNKVGINMFPVGLEYPVPIVTNDTYVPPRVVEPFVSSLFPLSPLPLTPIIATPFVPTVINIPNL